MANPRLIYFDMKVRPPPTWRRSACDTQTDHPTTTKQGRAEPIRLAFAVGGTDFEDVRISRDAFQAAKDQYPFGQLPVMEIEGRTVAQSQALLRYAGKRAGLYPADAMQALLVDEAMGGVEDVIGAVVPSLREQDEGKRVRKERACVG